MKKVCITKYALTTGVIECEMEVREEGKSCFGKPPGYYFSTGFFGKDFHLTKEEAIKDCEDHRDKKLKSIEKQIEKIKKLKF